MQRDYKREVRSIIPEAVFCDLFSSNQHEKERFPASICQQIQEVSGLKSKDHVQLLISQGSRRVKVEPGKSGCQMWTREYYLDEIIRNPLELLTSFHMYSI